MAEPIAAAHISFRIGITPVVSGDARALMEILAGADIVSTLLPHRYPRVELASDPLTPRVIVLTDSGTWVVVEALPHL